MTKDYAKKKRTQLKQNTRLKSSLLWLLTGFMSGCFLTSLVFLKPQPAAIPDNTVARNDTKAAKVTHENPVVKSQKPKFDFYTLLPEMEVIVPQQTVASKKAATLSTAAAATATLSTTDNVGNYVLQLASFKNYADAEEQKAKLALLGFEVNIETVTVNNETWHRIRLGPYAQLTEVQGMRHKLHNHDINSLVVKLKG